MAHDRLAKILKGMAAKKDIKTPHYRIYLCLFAGVQEESSHNQKSLAKETGMSMRTVQRSVKELIEFGTIQKDEKGVVSLTFDPGITSDRVGASDAKVGASSSNPPKSLSILKNKKSYILYYISPNQISNIRDKKRKDDITLKILDLPKGDLMRVDDRFRKVVDGIFEVYEKEIGQTLNLLFKAADGAMVKRMLTKLPEESVDRLVESFKRFITTNDGFDADQVKQTPVRYWATRATKWLPDKELDFKRIRANMLRKED